MNNSERQLFRATKTSEVRLMKEKVARSLSQDETLKSIRVGLPVSDKVTFMVEVKSSNIRSDLVSVTFHLYNMSNQDQTIWYRTHIYHILSTASGEKKELVANTCYSKFKELFMLKGSSTQILHSPQTSKDRISQEDKIHIIGVIEQPCAIENFCLELNDKVEYPCERILSDMFKDDSYTDFHFKFGDRVLKVHRSILAIRSKVFKAMFNSDTKERQDGFVEITDTSYGVFVMFIRYLYYNSMAFFEDHLEELLVVADKYDVQELKRVCEDHLSQNLDKENAVRFLNIADKYNCQNLKKNALRVTKFYLKECSDFKTLYRIPDLLDEVVDLIDQETIEPPSKKRK